MENYRVTATELNIRNAPSNDAGKIGRLHKNDLVEAIEKSTDAKWLKFKKDDIEGWSSLGYLDLITANGDELSESSFDYSKLLFLDGLTRDKKLTAEQAKNFYTKGIVPLCDNKEFFNKARAEGYAEVPDAQVAPCATTTSAVLEYAFRLAGMPVQAEIFNDHSRFAPTHNVEKMLYRLDFRYWLKTNFKSQKGAIGLLKDRHTFHDSPTHTTPKHSGHIYTIFSEIDAKYDMIGDNGGYNHKYRGPGWQVGTEGFWLPSGIIPQKR